MYDYYYSGRREPERKPTPDFEADPMAGWANVSSTAALTADDLHPSQVGRQWLKEGPYEAALKKHSWEIPEYAHPLSKLFGVLSRPKFGSSERWIEEHDSNLGWRHEAHPKFEHIKVFSAEDGSPLGTIRSLDLDAVRKLAKASPFGMGAETVYDEAVRRGLEVRAAHLQLGLVKPLGQSGRFRWGLNDNGGWYFGDIAYEVGRFLFPGARSVKLVLYKLAIYSQGGHFKMHKDTTHADSHVGTVLVGCGVAQDDSPGDEECEALDHDFSQEIEKDGYSGGDLVILNDDGEEQRYHIRPGQVLAFCTDVPHAVDVVTSGVKLTLQFDVYLEDDSVQRENTVACVDFANRDAFYRSFRDPLGLGKILGTVSENEADDEEAEQAPKPEPPALPTCSSCNYPGCVASDEKLQEAVDKLTTGRDRYRYLSGQDFFSGRGSQSEMHWRCEEFAFGRYSIEPLARGIERFVAHVVSLLQNASATPAPNESAYTTPRTVAFLLSHMYRKSSILPGYLKTIDAALYESLVASKKLRVVLHHVTYITRWREHDITGKLQPPQAAPEWNYTPERVKAELQALLFAQRAGLDKIVDLPTAERTFASVFGVLALLEADIMNQGEALSLFRDVSADAALRAASQAAAVAIDEFKIERDMRLDLFDAMKDARANTADAELTSEDLRLAVKLLLDGKRAGLDLPEAKREELSKLKKELAVVETEFQTNCTEENGKLTFTLEELSGVSEGDISGFKKCGDGSVEVSFKLQDYGAIMSKAKNSDTRRRMWEGHQGRLAINAPVLDKMLSLRRQIAAVLGYETWADYVAEAKMTKNGQNIVDFLANLECKMRPIGLNDLEEILAIKREDDPNGDYETMYAWDNSYYSRLHALRTLQLDGEVVKQYFPVDKFVQKVMEIYEEMLGVKFVPLSNDFEKGEVWHPDVLRYAVWEAGATSSADFIGYVYLDLYPRDGKFGGTAHWPLTSTYIRADETRHYPFSAMVASLAKPTPDRPALMGHFDTVLFFHEMGHIFHDLLSRPKYARFHGTNVNGDFGEAPSQMLENWCYVPAGIARMSAHYETGEPMPGELIDKLVKKRVRYRLIGLFMLFQLSMSKYDITVHMDKGTSPPRDTTALWHALGEATSLFKRGTTPLPGQGAFQHLVGYAPGYYCYAYSQVFSADMFRTVFAADPFSKEAGRKYRTEVLEPGASRDEMETLITFLGRQPNSDAFFEQLLGKERQAM
ncbi:zincin [Auricularia subglabra TFB-10046 SS5]|nr:zincin [Auricularia subglabra TFB-10046 SS5]